MPYCSSFLKTLFHGAYWVTLIFVPIATMLTIMTNVAMNNKAGIIGGVSAMLIITLSIPNGETFLYVFARIFETFIGRFRCDFGQFGCGSHSRFSQETQKTYVRLYNI